MGQLETVEQGLVNADVQRIAVVQSVKNQCMDHLFQSMIVTYRHCTTSPVLCDACNLHNSLMDTSQLTTMVLSIFLASPEEDIQASGIYNTPMLLLRWRCTSLQLSTSQEIPKTSSICAGQTKASAAYPLVPKQHGSVWLYSNVRCFL